MDTITPTPERIAKDRSSYQRPEVSQTTKREYGRFRPWYETMEAKGSITAEQAMAAREFDTSWHAVHDERGIVGGYGQSRADGTPVSQLDMRKLLGPEWREHCRSRLIAARNMLEPRTWDALAHCLATNGSLRDVAVLLNISGADSTMRAAAGKLVRQALHELSVLWGFSRPFHPPTR